MIITIICNQAAVNRGFSCLAVLQTMIDNWPHGGAGGGSNTMASGRLYEGVE